MRKPPFLAIFRFSRKAKIAVRKWNHFLAKKAKKSGHFVRSFCLVFEEFFSRPPIKPPENLGELIDGEKPRTFRLTGLDPKNPSVLYKNWAWDFPGPIKTPQKVPPLFVHFLAKIFRRKIFLKIFQNEKFLKNLRRVFHRPKTFRLTGLSQVSPA